LKDDMMVEILKNSPPTARVDDLKEVMLQQDQVDCPVIHRFGPGVYIREIFVPAGTLAIGHRHKFEHMNVFLKGRVTILDDDGTARELVAPMIFAGKPGRKFGYIHEDMVWLNIYATDEADVEKLEQLLFEKDLAFEEAKRVRDGIKLLTPSAQEEAPAEQLPPGDYKIKVTTRGVFATAGIEPGESMGPLQTDGKETLICRRINCSKNPNAKSVEMPSGDTHLLAISQITGCKGGFDGEEITIAGGVKCPR